MTWSAPAFETLARLLALRTGLVFPDDRRPGVELGIRRAMERAGVDDPRSYCDRLERDAGLFDDLVGELTIGETYFFREPGHFQFLRQTILPALRRRWGDAHIVRAWSAGCSSGEEAYSLAMVCAEEGLADRAYVLGTDVSPAALAKARRGSYGPWSLRGEGAAAALPHLDRHGRHFIVREPIRRRVIFEPLNLALDIYPSLANGTWGLDLIFCRNVLIYFDRETVRAVATRLHAALGNEGWLITASSDPPLSDAAPYETVVTDQGIFYRKTTPAPAVLSPWPVGPPPESEKENAIFPTPSATPGGIDSGPEPLRASASIGAAAVQDPTPLSRLGEELTAARADLAQGHYADAAERARAIGDVSEAAALRVRALANLDPAEAERACALAIERHPLSGELHYLHAVLLHTLGRDDDAARAARRVLFLDRSMAIAHFLHGVILRRRGDRARAWRAFRNARDLCAARPAAEIVPLSDGEPAGRLAETAALQMAQIGPAEERP
jgi:chemotaxis protein methyltransferase CheR